MGEVDRRTFFRKAGAGAAAAAAAGFVLTKVSDSVALAEARVINDGMNLEPVPPVTGPLVEVYTNCCVELWGRKQHGGWQTSEEFIATAANLDKDGNWFKPASEVLHRWLVQCRVHARGRDEDGRRRSPGVELFPLQNVKVENDTGSHLWIESARGHILAIPGAEFDCDLGAGPFLNTVFGKSFRAATPGENHGFWLTAGYSLTLDWADGGRPLVTIG